MDHEVALIRIGFCKVDLITLAGLAEMDNVSQILFRRRCNIAVRRSKRIQLQIFFILASVRPPLSIARTAPAQHRHRSEAGMGQTG